MSVAPLITLLLINIAYKPGLSLDSVSRNGRNKLGFSINTRSAWSSLCPKGPTFKTIEPGHLGPDPWIPARDESPGARNRNTKLFSHQKFVLVHSPSPPGTPSHFTNLFPPAEVESVDEDEVEAEEGEAWEEEPIAEGDECPDNEDFFDQFAERFEKNKNPAKLNWMHPMPCAVSQMTALSCVSELMPKSRVAECFEVTDGTPLEEIVSTKLGPYYTAQSYDLFFKYQKGFHFDMDGGEVVKSDIKPLKIDKPHEAPELEADKPAPSIPVGWRTFAVLGLFDAPSSKDDPSAYWCSRPLSDGDPPPRVSSGLFKYGEFLNFMASRDAVAPDGSLLYARDKIAPGEEFTGEKGDMSVIASEPPEEHRTISRESYPHRISEDGVWLKKHFQGAVARLSILQALWARLSTTLLRSTSKVIRLYKLRTRKLYSREPFSVENKLDVAEYYRNRRKGPVEFDAGVLYFVAAPTLHHALQMACSDPMARSNLYRNLLMFEVEDALRDKLASRRGTDLKNPREYLVLGRFAMDEPVGMLADRMLRFLIRSNCVKTYLQLKSPRRDSLADLSLPLHQLLPPRQYLGAVLRDPRVRSACLNLNASAPVGDLALISKFEFDEALEWARRSPHTRAGCYESLFVAMAHEVGFYGQNCRFVVPVPVTKKMVPCGQEYLAVNRDPLKILSARMKQHSGHVLALPHNVTKFVRRPGTDLANLKKRMRAQGDRLLITVRKSVANRMSAQSVSGAFAAAAKQAAEYELAERGAYSVLLPGARRSRRRARLCDVQSLPFAPLTLEFLRALLEQNAPTELDRPFYARFLRDYVYVSLPEGHFFEPDYACDNRRFNAGEPGEMESNVGAEEMLLLDEHRVRPVTGFWARKRDLFMFRNGDHLVIAPNRLRARAPMDPQRLRAILVQSEVQVDILRRGGALDRIDTSNSYTRYEGRLVSHLTPEEGLKTAYTVPPLNRMFARFGPEDELPSARFDEKRLPYHSDDPRYLMALHPYEVYQIQLEFMDKLDRGLVSIEEEPIQRMLECGPPADASGISVSTWEEPDKNLFDPGALSDSGESESADPEPGGHAPPAHE